MSLGLGVSALRSSFYWKHKQFQRPLHSSAAAMRQNRLPAWYYRGGTSRAVMFQTHNLPEDKSLWPAIFRGVIGSPDIWGRQLDGMGGGISSLSKVCVVGPSTRADADVDYTFAAIGVKDDEVDFSSNCGEHDECYWSLCGRHGSLRCRC